MLRRTLGFLASLAALLLASCGTRAVGYGVVLWGEPSGTPRTGEVVSVLRESLNSNTCIIAVPGEKTPRDYPLGRVRTFGRRAEAAAFAKTYADNFTTWALVMKQDSPPLPVRDTPSPDGTPIYKLQGKQLVKVVSRSAEQVTVDPYTDYWYEIATQDGYRGWTFGHYLKLFSVTGDPSAEAQRILSQDETLDRIMNTTWRPDWFRTMLSKGAIDLTVFREDVGLFPSPAEKLMRLVLPLSTFEFHYTEIRKIGAASYEFAGTDLRIDVLDEERINVSYRSKDQPVTALYALMTEDVAEVIATEQQRRADLYAALVKKGATLSSSAYGTIKLQEGSRFAWDGFGKLVPSLIGPDARGTGVVDFTLHVSRELSASYDGVITFIFDEYPNAGVSFLYQEAAGGLRFTSLAKDSVQDLFVTHPGFSPVVIFFTQSP